MLISFSLFTLDKNERVEKTKFLSKRWQKQNDEGVDEVKVEVVVDDGDGDRLLLEGNEENACILPSRIGLARWRSSI